MTPHSNYKEELNKRLAEIRQHYKEIMFARNNIENIINASNLDRKLKTLLRWRLVQTLTLEEVGKKWGVTRERIRQMEAKAMELI